MDYAPAESFSIFVKTSSHPLALAGIKAEENNRSAETGHCRPGPACSKASLINAGAYRGAWQVIIAFHRGIKGIGSPSGLRHSPKPILFFPQEDRLAKTHPARSNPLAIPIRLSLSVETNSPKNVYLSNSTPGDCDQLWALWILWFDSECNAGQKCSMFLLFNSAERLVYDTRTKMGWNEDATSISSVVNGGGQNFGKTGRKNWWLPRRRRIYGRNIIRLDGTGPEKGSLVYSSFHSFPHNMHKYSHAPAEAEVLGYRRSHSDCRGYHHSK